MPPKGAGVIRDKNGTKEAEEKKNREKGRYWKRVKNRNRLVGEKGKKLEKADLIPISIDLGRLKPLANLRDRHRKISHSVNLIHIADRNHGSSRRRRGWSKSWRSNNFPTDSCKIPTEEITSSLLKISTLPLNSREMEDFYPQIFHILKKIFQQAKIYVGNYLRHHSCRWFYVDLETRNTKLQ